MRATFSPRQIRHRGAYVRGGVHRLVESVLSYLIYLQVFQRGRQRDGSVKKR